MPNLDKYSQVIKITNKIITTAAKGINSISNGEMPLKNDAEKNREEKVSKDDITEIEKVEKEAQIERFTEKSSNDDGVDLEFDQVSLTQAFIYSEIFGKPKGLRRGR